MAGSSIAAQRLAAIASALSIEDVQRHIFLCCDATVPRCAQREEGARVWAHLKRRLTELGLASNPPSWRGQGSDPPPATPASAGSVLRTKVDCLRVCEQGPICVVYPEGIWYHSVTVEVMERIIQQHLLQGKLVDEHVFARSGDPVR